MKAPFDVRIEDAPRPTPGPGQFLVRVLVTGISAGTELMWYDGTNPGLVTGRVAFPFQPGYEHVGIVEEVGAEVAGVKAGDRVMSFLPHVEYGVLEADGVYAVLEDGMESEKALFTALGATAVNTMHRSRLELGERVAVVGLGILGTCVGQVARAAGASLLAGVDLLPWRRENAMDCGFDLVLGPGEADVPEAIADATDGFGADVCFEAAGGAANVVTDAMRLVREGGRVVVTGQQTQPFSVDGEVFWDREVSIIPVRAAGEDRVPEGKWLRWTLRNNFLEAFRLVRTGRLTAGRNVTHHYPIERIADAYEMIRSRKEDFFQIALSW